MPMLSLENLTLPFSLGLVIGLCSQKLYQDTYGVNNKQSESRNCKIQAQIGHVEYRPQQKSPTPNQKTALLRQSSTEDFLRASSDFDKKIPTKKNDKKKKKKKKGKHDTQKDLGTKTELSPELVTPTVSHEYKVSESEAELDSQNIINNEIEVLKSIYTDDLVVNRYQSKLYNAELTLNLEVVHRQILLCKIKLLVRYAKNYPKEAPVIEIAEHERLPEQEIETMEEIIEKEIDSHLKRKAPVVFDLCQSLMEVINAFAEPRKKYVFKVDMNSKTMWDKREEENKTRVLEEEQLKQSEKELKKKQSEEAEFNRQLSIKRELEMRKTVENKGVWVSEKAQEYQQYLDNQNAHRHRLEDEDMNLLREPHSMEDVEISPTKSNVLSFKNRRTSFKTEESGEDYWDKQRKMTVESGKLDSSSKAPKESRLHSDFEIKGHLGEGGGGSVYLAKNKIDENLYAIKKIKLDPTISKKVMKEVRFLSKLSHKHIVRYYNAWTEDVNPIPDSEDEEEEEEEEEDEANERLDTSRSHKSKKKKDDDDDLRYDATNMKGYEDQDEESYMAFDRANEEAQSENDFVVFAHDDGYDSEDPSEGQSMDEPSTPKKAKKKKDNYLLIQMEYCDSQSLRSIIDSNKLDPESRIKLIKQILEALKYLHDNNIIHRDLKPANIFLTKKMEIKLGDFGLATVAGKKKDDGIPIMDKIQKKHSGLLSGLKSVHSAMSLTYEESHSKTIGIGTGHYRSPELRVSGRYDEKTDMYSLGVIIFEMCYPFTTGMEREECLRRLSQFMTFPDDFDPKCGADSDFMKKTVKSLLANNPVNRPTSTALYDVFWRQYYKRLNESFEDKLGLLTLFFMKKNSITELLSYPNGKIEPMEIDMMQIKHNFFAFDQMERLLTNVFKNHDGIKIQIDDIIPFRSETILDRFLHQGRENGTVYEKSVHVLYNAVKEENCHLFLSKEGVILQLPSDNYRQLARFAAKSSFDTLKSYSFSDHRKRDLKKDINYYTKNREASFSIIYPAHNPDESPRIGKGESFDIVDRAYETEILFMVFEALNAMRLKSSIKIKISHTAILDYLIQELRIPDHKIENFLELFKHPNELLNKTSTIEEMLRALELTNSPIHKTLELLLTQGLTKEEIVEKLKKNNNHVPAYLLKVLEALCTLITDTKKLFSKDIEALEIPIEICFHPVSSHFFFHSGLYFQVVSTETHVNAQRKHYVKVEKIMEGGRFDNLIKNYSMNASESQHKGIGIRVFCTNLLHAFTEKLEFDALQPHITHTEILVASKDPMWDKKLKICSDLWLHDVRANYLHDVVINIDSVIRTCRKQKIKLLVVLKESWHSQGRVKVWDVTKNMEIDETLDRLTETLIRMLQIIKSHIEKDLRRAVTT